MKLLRFKDKINEQTRVGAIKDKNIIDLSEVNLPTDMIDFINLGDEGLETAKEYLESSIVGISTDDDFAFKVCTSHQRPFLRRVGERKLEELRNGPSLFLGGGGGGRKCFFFSLYLRIFAKIYY